MPDGRLADIRALLRVLLTEEELLNTLVELGNAQQMALVKSDFDALNYVNEQLLAVASGLEPVQVDRERILASIGAGHLDDAIAMADELGEHALSGVRDRLLLAAHRFRAVQERNAELILNASRLRERWVAMLAGMAGNTYGSGGKAEQQQGRRLVSKSA